MGRSCRHVPASNCLALSEHSAPVAHAGDSHVPVDSILPSYYIVLQLMLHHVASQQRLSQFQSRQLTLETLERQKCSQSVV